MNHLGAIVLSYEESGELSGILPWKSVDSWLIHVKAEEAGFKLAGFVPLSTCNRIEFYYSLDQVKGKETHKRFFEWILSALPPLEVRPALKVGRDAIRHLLRLGTGLESMLLGETEIRSQIKNAADAADQRNLLDLRLRTLFQKSMHESRMIRSELPLSRLPLSIPAIATRKLLGVLAPQALNLKESQVKGSLIVIGSGPMSRNCAELLSRHFSQIIMVNRTPSRVEDVAARIGATVLDFETFMNNPESLQQFDPRGIVTATSRTDSFITLEFINRLMPGSAPSCLLDLALPPDVDSDCAQKENVVTISMESIRGDLQANTEKKEEANAIAEPLIQEALIRIEASLISRSYSDILKDLQKEIREKSRQELQDLLGTRLSHLSRKDLRMLYDWAIRANKKMNRIHQKGVESVLNHYYTREMVGREEPPAS